MSRRISRADVYPRYYPVDEILEQPKVRLLRALRRFDWADLEDLRVALDVPHDKRQWNILSTHLGRLVREGDVERQREVGMWSRYRLTDKGRRELEQLLARGTMEDFSWRDRAASNRHNSAHHAQIAKA